MTKKIIKVGMADLAVTKSPNILTTLGLGSCVGIALYDRFSKIAGLAHIMLPSSRDIKNNSNKAKFADSGIVQLIDFMERKGAKKSNLTAKIVGGSQMFNFNSNNNILKIGKRNVNATKDNLKKMNIRLVAEDTGGNYGRTIEFDSLNGSLYIRIVGHGEKTI